MKKLVLVLLVLIALIGVASATCSCVAGNCKNCTTDLPSYAIFKMTSQVQGDGLVVADRDIKMYSPDEFVYSKGKIKTKYCCIDANGNPGQQLKMHTHGTGSYEETSDVSYNLNNTVAKLAFNDSATMTRAATSLDVQQKVQNVDVQWKEDICMKDYQIGVAMRERYYAAESVTKTTKGDITSVATKTNASETNTGYGSMNMSVDSNFNGWGHFGVLATNSKTTFVDVSEDYFGSYTMKKTASIKVPKKPYKHKPTEDWLPCDNPEEWCDEFLKKCPSCPNIKEW